MRPVVEVGDTTFEGTALSLNQPFAGLRPYEEADANWFYGRSAEINDLLKRLRRLHFVAIVGASGSGKSSLVRAGVMPQIRDGYLDAEWQVAAFRPGEHPIANLAEVLGPGFAASMGDPVDVLRSGPVGLIRGLGPAQTESGRLLILVDQFEELFQFAQRRGDAAQEEIKEFLKLLFTAANSDEVAVYVVITMRLEWLHECAAYPGLAEAINEGIYLVPQMQRRQFGQAILGPLEAAGGSLTTALMDRMLNDLDNQTDQLPVLQHALLRLWERSGSQAAFDLSSYDAVGTLSNCLSAHAEEIFNELTPRQKLVAEHVFRSITQVSKNRKIRRPRPVRDLMGLAEVAKETGAVSLLELRAVITAFRRPGRSFLVTTQGELTPQSIVDISHEALIRQWSRLSNWVDSQAEIRARLARLEEDAAEWDRDRPNSKSCLYSGARLLRAQEVANGLTPGSVEDIFLRESIRAHFWQIVRRRGWIAAAAVMIVLLALSAAYVSSEHAKLSEVQRAKAETEANLASQQAQKAEQFTASLEQRIDAARGSATALAAISQDLKAKRVYLQYSAAAAPLAKSAEVVLQGRGFIVPGLQQVDNSPQVTEVRYYHLEDREGAQSIAGLLKPVFSANVTVSASTNPRDLIPRGQFELAIAADAKGIPKSPAATTPSAAPAAVTADSTPAPAPVAAAPPPAASAPSLTVSLASEKAAPGSGVLLTWHSENASSVQLEGVGNVEPNGSLTVSSQTSTTYRLTARGEGGSVTRTAPLEIVPVAAAAPAPSALATAETAGVRAALDRYTDAYESESLDEVKRIWPTISKDEQAKTRNLFKQFNAIHITTQCREDAIRIEGETASANCQLTYLYTLQGRRQPPQVTRTEFKLRKSGPGWLVEAVK